MGTNVVRELLVEIECTVLEVTVQEVLTFSIIDLEDVNCCSKLFQFSVVVPLNCGMVILLRFAMRARGLGCAAVG